MPPSECSIEKVRDAKLSASADCSSPWWRAYPYISVQGSHASHAALYWAMGRPTVNVHSGQGIRGRGGRHSALYTRLTWRWAAFCPACLADAAEWAMTGCATHFDTTSMSLNVAMPFTTLMIIIWSRKQLCAVSHLCILSQRSLAWMCDQYKTERPGQDPKSSGLHPFVFVIII